VSQPYAVTLPYQVTHVLGLTCRCSRPIATAISQSLLARLQDIQAHGSKPFEMLMDLGAEVFATASVSVVGLFL
jgi:hypothetical protein